MPAAHIPDLREIVVACRDDPLAVRAERGAPGAAGVRVQKGQLAPGCDVPDPHRPVGAGGDDPPSVGAEGHAVEARSGSDDGEPPPGRHAPDPRRPVGARADDPSSVGTEVGVLDDPAVPTQDGNLAAGRGVPDPHRAVVARGDDPPATRAERRASHHTLLADGMQRLEEMEVGHGRAQCQLGV